MPTPERTSLDEIVLAARDLLEQDGLAGLTMQAVAVAVGVKAPSLYKRVAGRDALIRLVAEATLSDLGARLAHCESALDLVNSYRAFAHERPAAFHLIMSPDPSAPDLAPEFGLAATRDILRVTAQLAGERDALEAARTLTSWATGFIGMELTGSFRFDGDIDRAWDYGARHLVEAITAR